MLSVEKLNQYYGESHTLWDLDLEVPEGECTVIMGRNGVGKTTLLQAIMGLLPIRSGSIQYRGDDISKVIAEKRAGMGIGYVPQGRQIFPLLTVQENLEIGLPVRKDKKVPEFIFELFPVLREMLGRRGGDLSGGQQQQLAIGRALASGPRLLILDEPTRGVDVGAREEMFTIIGSLVESGMAVLLISSDLSEVVGMSHRIAVFRDGRVLKVAPAESVSLQRIMEQLTGAETA